MPEILTESFCERCGTRYTFESAAPTKARKLGKFKTLSKGLKNYVLSDESSMDEAMAAARSDAEREVTSQQLDAFHETFNFCMTCRQYTCGNCWNQVEGSCLTCTPHLGHEIAPAPFPELTSFLPAESPSFDAAAWPASDLVSEDAEETADLEEVAAVAPAAPAHEAVPTEAWPIEAELAAEAESVAEDVWASAERDEVEPVEVAAEVEPVEVAAESLAVVAEPVEVAAESLAVFAEQPDEALEVAAELSEDAAHVLPGVATAPDAVEPQADPTTRAASAAQRTADLLAKFRPGQSLDDELDAYEAAVAPGPFAAEEAPAEQVAAEPVYAEPVVAEAVAEPLVAAGVFDEAELIAEPEAVAELVAEPELVGVEAEAEAELFAAQAEAEPEAVAEAVAEPEFVAEPDVVAEPEPTVAAAAAEPEAVAEPELVGAEPEQVAAEAGPQPEPVRADVVEQPTWRIVAPDTPAPVINGHPAVPDPSQPAAAATASSPVAPAVEPQWPKAPEWPVAQPDPSLFARGRSSASSATDALWAASARDVIATPAGAPAGGVQPCSSCGLSLSATARFCRRCGSRQGA